MSAVNISRMKASNKQAGKKAGVTVFIFILLFVLGAFMILPIYLTLVMSVKPVEELFVFPPKLYTLNPTLDNFKDMFGTVFPICIQQRICNGSCNGISMCIFSYGGICACKI